jgi:putative FmdB family regulatory protein
MPLYEYECPSCSQRFERIRKFSDVPLETCPLCGGGPVQKLISSPAIQFKGSGFYLTDYGRKGSDAATGGDPKKGGESTSGGDSKSGSDSKSGGDSKSGSDSKSGGETKTAGESKSTPAAAPSKKE